MKISYWDTALVIKLYTHETGSAEVRAAVRTFDRVVISAIAQAEIPSAFHRKLREGEWSPSQLKAALSQMDLDLANGILTMLPLTPEIWTTVRMFYEKAESTVYLRAPDAIHLATCAAAGFREIYSNDRHLLGASIRFGITGVNPVLSF